MDTKVKRIEGKLKEVIMNPNIPGMNPQPAQPMPNAQPGQPQQTANVQSQGYTQNQYVQPAYQQVVQPTYPQNQQGYQRPIQSVTNTVVQPQPTANAQPQGYSQNQYVQPAYQQAAPVAPQPGQMQVDPMTAVTNLNKEEAMEEALSHTTQYSPFQAQVAEIRPETEQANNKKALIIIGAIVVIVALFIMFLPEISNLFGWGM